MGPLTLSTPSHLHVLPALSLLLSLAPPQESLGCQTAYIVSYGNSTSLLPAQTMEGVFVCRVVATGASVLRDTLVRLARRQPDDSNRTVFPP